MQSFSLYTLCCFPSVLVFPPYRFIVRQHKAILNYTNQPVCCQLQHLSVIGQMPLTPSFSCEYTGETLSWFSELITSFVWLLNPWMNPDNGWISCIYWSCFKVPGPDVWIAHLSSTELSTLITLCSVTLILLLLLYWNRENGERWSLFRRNWKD